MRKWEGEGRARVTGDKEEGVRQDEEWWGCGGGEEGRCLQSGLGTSMNQELRLGSWIGLKQQREIRGSAARLEGWDWS